MKILEERPPIWDQVISRWNINPESTVFTFGDTLYNPGKNPIPEHLMRHEETHSVQQGHTDEGAAKWWVRYLDDPHFRIDQEAEAFAVQYLYFCNNVSHDRNQQARFLFEMAARLSSPTYGSVIGSTDATKMIKDYAKEIAK